MKYRNHHDRERTGDSVSDVTEPRLEPQTSITMRLTTSPTERNFPSAGKLELSGQRIAGTEPYRYVGFDSRPSQIEHSVANGSPPLRCFFKAAVLPRR